MRRKSESVNPPPRKIASTPAQFQFDVPHIGAVGTGDLFVESDVPEFMTEWGIWLKALLVPEWSVRIGIQDTVSDSDPNTQATTEMARPYLSARITLRRDTEDDTDGHLVLCHEFSHIFVSRLASANITLASTADAAMKSARGIHQVDTGDDFDSQTMIALKCYDDAEEETVVKMARVLVGLRYSIMDAGESRKNLELAHRVKLRRLRAKNKPK